MIGSIKPSYFSPRNFILWGITYLILLFSTHKFSDYNTTFVLIYSIFMVISYIIIIYTFFVRESSLNERNFFKQFGKKYEINSKNVINYYTKDLISNATHMELVVCNFKDLQQNVYAIYKNESEVIGWHDFSYYQKDMKFNLEEMTKRILQYNKIDIEITNVYYESIDKQSIFYKLLKPLKSLLGSKPPVRMLILTILYVVATILLFMGLGVSISTTFWFVTYIFGFIFFGLINYVLLILSAEDYIDL